MGGSFNPFPGRQPDVAFYEALGELLASMGQGPDVFAEALHEFAMQMLRQGYLDAPTPLSSS